MGQTREALRDMEKARQLAPDDPNIPNGLMMMYRGAREYTKSDEVADAAIAHFPNGPNYYFARKVSNALDRGDVTVAAERVAAIPVKFNASGFKSLLHLSVLFLQRDYREFARVAGSIQRDDFVEKPIVFMEALIAEKEGDRPRMASLLSALATKLEADVQAGGATKGPRNDPLEIAQLARTHCYLGRMDEALRESEQAIQLSPTAKDAVNGPGNEAIRAEVLMRAGKMEEALVMLGHLATIPYGPSYGELLNLRWDALRNDSRFQQIVEAARMAGH